MDSKKAYIAALEWHLDAGASEPLEDFPQDRTVLPARDQKMPERKSLAAPESSASHATLSPFSSSIAPFGAPDAARESLRLARDAKTLEALKEAISGFDGLSIKTTATNLVFSDGNPAARVMLVGEAPGADEDRQGKPFAGVSGELLDRILSFIGLDRQAENPQKALYISNILNWRPPGNRTPTPAEVEISLPFIEKHIALVKPDVLIFAGGIAAQALLGKTLGISRLRGKFQDYTPRTQGLFDMPPPPIAAIATYHPAFLLQTPSQKKHVWQDMLIVYDRIRENYKL